jgi:rhodanese-related sulfurtransferase
MFLTRPREAPVVQRGLQVVQLRLLDALAAAGLFGHASRSVGVGRAAIDVLVERARVGLDRLLPADLDSEVAAGSVVIDIRPVEQRLHDGTLPGAVVIDRNVLEWRLDPTSPYRLPLATDPDVRFVLVCNEGFSSSLAARTLRELGLSRATDLVGGYQAWLAHVDGRIRC